ncbi:YmfL family putative regulatory protein [Stutzerimonas stutzeri]|uniref:YmfL family putative regulatory protein n=1 Tax=Stutzerimonas stutzeri TaxID=316 RepID=UPI002108F46F|nr:YmfL family putative regulatory protein [Stutzerimonas stutzeri]MCQ4321475.1 hypothetical protein [Stutzerimonas stutzeri]
MKREILDSRRQVMRAVVASYPGGRECAAARLGLPIKRFDNQLYETNGCQPLSDEQLHQLEQDAGTAHLPDYVTALYGGVFVPIANPDELDNIELYSRSLQATAKRGVVDQIIVNALQDGAIDEREVEAILAAHRKHIAARHEEVQAVILLHTKRQQGEQQ